GLIGSDMQDAVIHAAQSWGQFREQARLCAARIARVLVYAGHEASDPLTAEFLEPWRTAPDDAFLSGRSARYLRETAQEHDLEFVLEHIDDLSCTYAVADGEVRERQDA